MTPELTHPETPPTERPDTRHRHPRTRHGQLGSLEVWSRLAPIRLAGYEDDPNESHILRGID
ncbi:hypothetical protein ACN20G_01585 [Streptomyces sp. BI20]|uniref:hypothetical protein n=1 Tax=Streptomyces sp. BI20 TaxID=3403460 RepID=UPI003C7416BD